jgi:anion-transporting  ArsA/GET3 family ATPase
MSSVPMSDGSTRRAERPDAGEAALGQRLRLAAGGSSPGETVRPGNHGGLAALLASRRVVVCCGPGGVGKTTLAAALGVAGARLGRATCVLTVDPARRLADALGGAELGNQPVALEGSWSGSLAALMLDSKGTFDELVRRYAPSERQAEAILGNRIYRNLTQALSGTHEYMAAEKLYELAEEGDFDLVVVDTPPTRHALDFLEAPERLRRFLDHRFVQLLLAPTRTYLRAVSFAMQSLLRTVAKVAGRDIVEDAVAFFRAFEGMEQGFRDRARRVTALLAGPETAYVLVTAPRRAVLDEASWFVGELARRGRALGAVVANRVHPDFGPPRQGLPPSLEPLAENAVRLHEAAVADRTAVAQAAPRDPGVPLVLVPLFERDLRDLAALEAVAEGLLAAGPHGAEVASRS